METKHLTFFSCLSNKLDSQEYISVLKIIENTFGSILSRHKSNDWNPPVPYVLEMGKFLSTDLILLESKLSIPELIKLKKVCMEIEYRTSSEGNRRYNLNPGYVSNYGMFLFTHKSNRDRNREYLGQSIWQEKQYEKDNSKLLPNSLTFSEFRINQRIRLLERNSVTAANRIDGFYQWTDWGAPLTFISRNAM